MRSSFKLGLALAVLSVGVAWGGGAQATPATGTMNATVNVLTALSVTATDLAFGNVAAGQSKTVAAGSAAAGVFTINGAPGASVNFTFSQLPSDLGDATVTIDTWTGSYGATTGVSDGTFTPSAAYTGTYTLNGSGAYYVSIGATVHTTAATPTTNYTGQIKADVVYN